MKSNLRFLRWFRILFAVVFFVAISVQFLDVYKGLPDVWREHNPAKLQFIPSLLDLLAETSILGGAAFLTFTIMALLFGRAYCSFFCAFGILMDAVRWVVTFPAKNRFLKKTFLGKFSFKHFAKLSFSPAWNILRGIAVGIAALCILFGITALLGLFDPYSLYGKVMGSVVYILSVLGVDQVSTFLMNRGNYSVSPVGGNVAVALPALGFALVVLFGITAISALRGRLYCNTVCPVGGFLGFLSKFSLFKLQLDQTACGSCGLCERECKAQCIHSKNKTLDFTRCVLCFNCTVACPRGGIRFVLNNPFARTRSARPTAKNVGTPPTPGKMNRRSFAQTLPAFAALFCMAAKVKENTPLPAPTDGGEPYKILPDASPYSIKGTRPDKRLPAPPGAKSLQNFLSHCTGCQLCVTACESQMLKPSITEWGLAGFMQPFLDFRKGFCLQDCIACSLVCPTGAIAPLTVEQKHVTKIGTALFREDLCVVKKDETDCSACGEHCPVSAIEMLPYKPEKHLYIPHVHEDVCIGCGACENICPVRPYQALVIQGLKVTQVAKVFDESMRLYIPPEQPTSTEPAAPLDNPFPF